MPARRSAQCVVVVAVGTVAWFVLPPDATTAGWLTGWEISIDSRRQKLAILLNVRPSVLPPLPLLSLPFPVVPAALTLYVPPVAKSGGQTLLKITSFPFWRSSYARGGRGEEGWTDEQWQRLAISASVLVVFLTLDCRRFTVRLAVLHFIILDSHRAPRSLRSVGRSVGGLISFIFGSHRSNAQRRAKK